MLIAVQLFVLGLYRPPVFTAIPRLTPPQTIISIAGPHGCVTVTTSGRVGSAGRRPTICVGIVFSPCVQVCVVVLPNLRPRQSFGCQSTPRCARIARTARCYGLVAVQLSVPGLYLPPVLTSSVPLIRPKRSFRCRSKLLCDRNDPRARW